VSEKSSKSNQPNLWLPILLMVVLAMARWPGLLPPNFSPVYALVYCAGVYLPRRLAWLPFVTLVLSDLALNRYYALTANVDTFSPMLIANYVAYAGLFGIGARFRPASAFLGLLAGGLLGAVVFYLLTNTAAWFFNPFGNPEYTRTFTGWLVALTKGTAGYAATWEFFRNTLLSGGLFTALFAGTMKLTAESPLDKDPEAQSARPSEKPEEAPAEPQAEEA